MPKQLFYLIVQAEGDDFSVALPTNNMFSIYCYLDNIIQSGRTFKSHFEPESVVVQKYRPIAEEMDFWR